MTMTGRIDVYLDIASLYSYVAFLELLKERETLQAHGVELEFHPVLLGAIMGKSGNQPPMALPAKGAYVARDSRRALKRVGNPPVKLHRDLMARAKTTIPLRALHCIKSHHGQDGVFVTTLHYLFHCFWAPDGMNLTISENVAKALSETPAGFIGAGKGDEHIGAPLFSQPRVNDIMKEASSDEMKDTLKAVTQEALDRGAFGAPWLWVTNSAGKSEPFFGSDRFHSVYKFLGLPFSDVTLLPPDSGKSRL